MAEENTSVRGYGYFVNPVPSSLSDLQNDNNYLAIREYKLNKDTLSQGSTITIDDLKAGSTIVKIALKVDNAFTSKENNDAIEIVTDSGETLFSKTSNDMNVTGTYSSDCYYMTNGNENELSINHTLYSIPDKYVTVGCNLDADWNLLSGNDFAYSIDGINWTEGTISSTSRDWYSVCYGNDKFVAVSGNGGDSFNTNGKYFAYSTDGINWTEGTISDTSRNWESVCCSNNSASISYGDATLMIEIFENIPEYNELLTSENEIYTTSNNIITEVTK